MFIQFVELSKFLVFFIIIIIIIIIILVLLNFKTCIVTASLLLVCESLIYFII